MVAPNIDIRVFDLSVYAPRVSGAIIGMVGPATKGPVNDINTFTDEGSFVDFHGRPTNRHYGPRAAIRYFQRGNQLNYVRIAGPNLATAGLTLYAADGVTPVLVLAAASPGTWANRLLAVSIQHNGTQSYNVAVFFAGQSVETFVALDNGTAVTRINNGSRRMTAQLAAGAGATFPGETINAITGAVDRLTFSGGDDGAFASTNSRSSSTGGVAGRRFLGLSNTSAGLRVFQNVLTITPGLASKPTIYGSVGMAVTPGTFTIRVQTAGGPTFVELADDATGGYTPGAAGIGQLKPAAGAHLGFIDYRTGAFGVKLVGGATTFNGGTVDGIWIRAVSESVGATAKGEGAYAGNLSDAALGVGYFNSNKALISVPIDEVVGIPDVSNTAASSFATLKTLAGWIIPGTVKLTPAHDTLSVPNPVYDDGFGGWRSGPNGTGLALTGTINYRTGVYSVVYDPTQTTPTMPAAGTLGGTYDIMLFDMGGGSVPGAGGTFVSAEVIQPSVPAPTAPVAGPVLAAVAGGAVDVGAHDYAVVFVTATGRSVPGTLTNIVIVNPNQTVNGTVVPLGPGGTTARIIVRTKAAAPGVYFVVTTIADNVTTVFVDAAADAGLVAYGGGGLSTVASTDAGAQLISGPIFPGSVHIDIASTSTPGAFRAYDNGVGGWLTRPRGDPLGVAVTGSIDYVTGAWTITLPGGAFALDATTVKLAYTSVSSQRARRALRGTGPQLIANVTPNAAGLNLTDPQSANALSGTNWLDHQTGAWAISLTLVPTGANTFDVADNGTLTAVYVPADILGFGDAANVTFTGILSPAPFRRQANRLIGFQGAQASAAGAGDPQLTFAKLGASAAQDYWSQNVAASSDPANHLDYRDGEASIKWTSAPLRDEAVFVVAEETVLHITSDYPGDIGNERGVITTGIYAEVGADPTLPGTLRLQVFFNLILQESFGQAQNVDELVTKVNDPTNGSALVTVTATSDSAVLPVDVTAVQRCGMSGAFTLADVIGTKVGQTYTGMQIFSNDETVPMHWLAIPGQWHTQVITAMQTLCEDPHRRALGIIPFPDLDDPLKFRDFTDGNYNSVAPGGVAVPTVLVPYPPLVAIDSNQLATISPWVNYFDSYTNANVWEPSDGDMIQRVAATPNPWQPIAGNRRGKITADQIRYSPSRGDRNLIYGVVGNTTEIINTIIRKQGLGLILGGQRTAARSPTALDRINVRWTVNVLMNLLDLISQDFLFELNDSILWREAAQALNKVLLPVVEARGLQDAFVVVDGTTTTADMIDRLEMGAKLFIKPARATEYITYDLILTPTGANFADVLVKG